MGMVVTINCEERDLLRGELQVCVPAEDFTLFIEGELESIEPATPPEMRGAIDLLDALGWELEGDEGEYELPNTPGTRAIIARIQGYETRVIAEDEAHDWAEDALGLCERLLSALDEPIPMAAAA